MDRLSFSSQPTKVVPTQNTQQVEGNREVPIGLDPPLPQHTAKPSSPQEGEINKEQSDVLQSVDPYSQPFTMEAAFSLSIADEFLPWFLVGYDLFEETKTSK